MGLQITDPFDQPYSERTQALPSYFSPSVIGIAGVPYLIDTSSDYTGAGRFKREAFDVVQNRNTNSQRDLLLLPADVWRQQAESWHQGAGQSNLDRDDALPYRYEESFGIDPWTHWQIGILPATQKLGSYTGNVWTATYGNYLAVINGTHIYWYDSVSASSPVGSTLIHSADPVIDIANMAASVTTLDSAGHVYVTAGPGATPTLKGTYANASFIAYEKDYLLCGKENKLYDITGGGAGTLIYTSPEAAFRWQSSASGNSCIYVLGGIQDKYVIHRTNIKADGTGLQPCIVAATLPDGEIGYCIDQYLGFILIGTDKGVRIATENNSSGDLTLGPIIPTAAPVRCFEGQDRFVWYGMSEMNSTYGDAESDIFPTGTVCGLGRMDLSTTTTSTLTPAYAPDICAISESGKTVHSVVTFQGKRVFGIDGSGVWAETDTLMQGGWLKQGTMSFSVEDLKTGLYVQAKWLPLVGEIDLDISYDSYGYIRLIDFIQQGTIRSGNTSLNGTQFSRINTRYVLKRDNDTVSQGPTMTRWEVRAIPVKGKASRWTLPIMNYEEIEIDGVKYTRDPLAVYDTLMNLIENSIVFTLQESGRAYQVHAKDFLWQPEKLSINGRAWEGTFVLVVEEVQ
jgi:hypothetical protein